MFPVALSGLKTCDHVETWDSLWSETRLQWNHRMHREECCHRHLGLVTCWILNQLLVVVYSGIFFWCQLFHDPAPSYAAHSFRSHGQSKDSKVRKTMVSRLTLPAEQSRASGWGRGTHPTTLALGKPSGENGFTARLGCAARPCLKQTKRTSGCSSKPEIGRCWKQLPDPQREFKGRQLYGSLPFLLSTAAEKVGTLSQNKTLIFKEDPHIWYRDLGCLEYEPWLVLNHRYKFQMPSV